MPGARSSYGDYLKAPGKRVWWLRVDRLLGEWGWRVGYPQGQPHGLYPVRVTSTTSVKKNPQNRLESSGDGRFLGDKEFRNELLAQMHQRRGDYYGPELREADLVRAERVLKEELGRRTWTELELSLRLKSDPRRSRSPVNWAHARP